MRSRRTLGFIILVLFVGAAAGTVLAELTALLLPEGVVKDFFVKSWTPVFGPAKLDVVLFNITLGFGLKVNGAGIIGILFAVYLLRWVLN